MTQYIVAIGALMFLIIASLIVIYLIVRNQNPQNGNNKNRLH